MKTLVLLLMILAHLIADYNLQGWLASAKQKQWWEDNALEELYRYDYIIALLCHSFMWSIMITLPTLLLGLSSEFLILTVFVNGIFHAAADNAKANWKYSKTIGLSPRKSKEFLITLIV